MTPNFPHRPEAIAPSGLPTSCATPSPASRYSEIVSGEPWISWRNSGVHMRMPTPMARAAALMRLRRRTLRLVTTDPTAEASPRTVVAPSG